MECYYPAKEISLNNSQIEGYIYLSNYKLMFKPSKLKVADCLRFTVPYGYITKI